MQLQILKPNKALNKAYLKEKVSRNNIETFKANLKTLLSKIKEGESEEHHKYPVADFLNDTWYKDAYYINTKDRADFVIHNGKTAKDTAGVILEVKSPTNTAEMITAAKPNKKALQELVLYYLRERIEHKNIDVKHLVVTNINEWYVFDEVWFEKNIFRNVRLKKDYENYKQSGKDTKFFYDSIARPVLDEITEPLACAYFNIQDYERIANNADKTDDNKLIPLYKLLSPTHLLKQPFANDSNSLDTKFYAELLHIIGLEEVKDGGKKLIRRKEKPDTASLLESAIIKLEDKDSLRNIDRVSSFGATREEQLFNVALELCITWVNRILFIKLLEGQLVTYNKGNKDYRFMNPKVIFDYDELNNLFFQVLAERPANRRSHVKDKFRNVPYLNSSLFERTSLERDAIEIDVLDNRSELPIHSATVLKDEHGKRRTGNYTTLHYLFDFLDAYDFSSDGGEEIQEENKNLINASVLGLIFEKINGYKDGSFFTPGFITMYMCRETIRRAVLQKFKEVKGWDCTTLDELHDRIDVKEKAEANAIINSLRICDPAVGSGHFLVSALNELIAIKSELRILQDRQHKSLRDYHVEVVNDELVVTDEDGNLLDYNPRSPESQRVQEALFHEKETLIENCLFGVDINPNSVKICRLRLWIELLKNTYYTADSGYTELETLPNIDINIKCGNSLISRFPLDADLGQALKKSKWNIDSYRIAVQTYRNAQTKDEKREMEQLIEDIKGNFRSEIANSDPKIKKLQKLNTEYYQKYQADTLFDAKLTKEQKKHKAELENNITKLDAEIKEIKGNRIYENAFEWRFEFPEVLDIDGKFIGFDSVIGNPPYGVSVSKDNGDFFRENFQVYSLRGESYVLFVERAISLLKSSGQFSYIIPDTILNLGFTEKLRMYLLKNTVLQEIDMLPARVFPDATVDTLLIFCRRLLSIGDYNDTEVLLSIFDKKRMLTDLTQPDRSFSVSSSMWAVQKVFNVQGNQTEIALVEKIDSTFPAISSFADMYSGIKLYEVGKGNPPQTEEIRNTKPFTSKTKNSDEWAPFFDGKDIGRYTLTWHEDNWIRYGPWLAAPRLPENFQGEKILIRKIIGKTLNATYIPYTSYCNTLLFVLKLRRENLGISYRSLLGILNSRLIGWYYKKKFQINDDDTFPQIMIRDILQFAVPNVRNGLTMKLDGLVDQMLTSNTVETNESIEQVVRELYGLTEDEIKIVEGA